MGKRAKHDNSLDDNTVIFVIVPQGASAANVGAMPAITARPTFRISWPGVFSTGLTLGDAADVYAMVVSHEIAEMIVDPAVGGGDPEVCDPCDINCSNLTRIYFDASDNFLGANQATPPSGFMFSYYVCAVVKPAGASDCPASSANCSYAPVDQALTLIVDKSTYGEDEVGCSFPAPHSTPNAYWVALDGFTAAELGFNAPADLGNPAPSPARYRAFCRFPCSTRTHSSADLSISANLPTANTFAAPVVAADPSLGPVTQRFLYPYTVSFASDVAFEQLNLDHRSRSPSRLR